MSDESRRKKRSEKLSDSFAARMTRGMASGDRLEALASDGHTPTNQATPDRTELASMQTQLRHSFTRCPHCREYVPIRDVCRGCGTPMN